MKKLYMFLFLSTAVITAHAQTCSSQFAGNWAGSDNCSPGGPFTYTATVGWYPNGNESDADTFMVQNFGGVGSSEYVMVIADCNTQTLTVPAQTVAGSWTLTGAGSFATTYQTMQVTYTLTSGSTSATCSSNYQRTSNTTGINDAEQQELRCYPNPSENVIYIETGKEVSKIEVYNSLGQLVVSEASVNGTYSLSKEATGTGAFIIRVINEKWCKTSIVTMK